MNGHVPPSNNGQEPSLHEQLKMLRTVGLEKRIGITDRVVRLKSVDPAALLKSGECPDILTPVLMRCIYGNGNEAVRNFVQREEFVDEVSVSDALHYLETIDRVVALAIADETNVQELTLDEKKLIFRLALGSAEMLVLFRHEPAPPMDTVEKSNDVSQAPARGFWRR